MRAYGACSLSLDLKDGGRAHGVLDVLPHIAAQGALGEAGDACAPLVHADAACHEPLAEGNLAC